MKIEKAILLAAGMGTRIRPISEETPKPLIVVNGTPMIETMIKSIKNAGIENIVIVVGYRKEKYYYLRDKYNGITFVENAEYRSKNTISSFYAARNEMRGYNCLITETDFYVANRNLIRGTIDKSRYLLIKSEPQDYEWGFEIINESITQILRPSKNKFLNHHMYGVSYWEKGTLDMLIEKIEEVYNDVNYFQKAYDEVANLILPEIELGYYTINYGDIFEIDSLEDLVKVDSSYTNIIKTSRENMGD